MIDLSLVKPIYEHPAKFSKDIVDAIAEMIVDHHGGSSQYATVLDPFGGIGLIHELSARDQPWETFAVELQPGWAAQSARHGWTYGGDWFEFTPRVSQFQRFDHGDKAWVREDSPPYFDVVATSCTYGNRMADKHNAKEDSKRMTYAHTLRRNGEELHPESSGGMQWGEPYRFFHMAAWRKAALLLDMGGLLIVNVKDHVRGGKLIQVADWHRGVIAQLCGRDWKMEICEDVHIEVRGMGFGQNQTLEEGLKVDYEHIYVFRKEGA